MIVAKVDVYDSESGRYFCMNKLIEPMMNDADFDDLSTTYTFGFKIRISNKEVEGNDREDHR